MTDYTSVIQQIESETSLAGIVGIVDQYSAAASGPGGILYSGMIGDVTASDVAMQLAEATGLPIVNTTPMGELLSNVDVENAIIAKAIQIFQGQGEDLDQATTSADSFLFGDSTAPADSPISLANSLWGQASAKFVDSLSGNITIVASSASADRIFAQIELPDAVLNGAITGLGGLSTSSLQGLSGSVLLDAVEAQSQAAVSQGYLLQTPNGEGGYNPVVTQEFASQLGLGSSILPSLAEVGASGETVAPVALSGGGFEIPLVGLGSGLLEGAGAAGLALDALTTSIEAEQQLQAGQNYAAAQTLADFAARLGVGLDGAELGAEGGAALGTALLGPAGAVFGAFVGMIGGGVAGALGGQDAVNTIATATSTLVSDLGSLFGAPSSPAAPPPASISQDPTLVQLQANLISQGVSASDAAQAATYVAQQAAATDTTTAQALAAIESVNAGNISAQQNADPATQPPTLTIYGPGQAGDANDDFPTDSIGVTTNADGSYSVGQTMSDALVNVLSSYSPDGAFIGQTIQSSPDASGSSWTQAADANGDTTFTDSYGDAITLNPAQQEVSTSTPDGQGGSVTQTFAYSSNGTQVVTSEQDLNSAGQLISNIVNTTDPTTGALVSSSETDYDSAGDEIDAFTTDGNNALTSYNQFNADGSSTSYAYASGEAVSDTQYAPGGAVVAQQQFAYDASGDLASITTDDGSGNLVSFDDYSAGDGSHLLTDYNSSGQAVEQTQFASDGVTVVSAESLSYESSGDLADVDTANGAGDYDPGGQLRAAVRLSRSKKVQPPFQKDRSPPHEITRAAA